MTYQLLATDLDGTLLDSCKRIPPTTALMMKKARELGKIIVLSTGRAPGELKDYDAELAYVDYGILVSGGLIYDFHQQHIIAQSLIPDELLEVIIAAAHDEQAMMQALGAKGVFLAKDDLAHIEDFHMEVYKPMYQAHGDLVDDVAEVIRKERTFEKINLYHRSAKSRERTYQRLKNFDLTLAYAEETSLEITPKGVSKGIGLKHLCSYLNIPLEDTIAIGDADNDLDIMHTAGLSVAVANANEKVLAAADVIVSDHDHEGVLEALVTYLLEED